jgi:hypothetical protein
MTALVAKWIGATKTGVSLAIQLPFPLLPKLSTIPGYVTLMNLATIEKASLSAHSFQLMMPVAI